MENKEPRRRVVLRQADGLHRIIGTYDPSVHTIRDTVQFSRARNGQVVPINAALVRVEDRLVLYAECP